MVVILNEIQEGVGLFRILLASLLDGENISKKTLRIYIEKLRYLEVLLKKHFFQ